MQEIPLHIQLALGKSEGEPLTNDEIEICEEWSSGIALEYKKIDTDDPRILEYAGLWDKLEDKKEAVWQSIAPAGYSFNTPIQVKPVWWKRLIASSTQFISSLLFLKKSGSKGSKE